MTAMCETQLSGGQINTFALKQTHTNVFEKSLDVFHRAFSFIAFVQFINNIRLNHHPLHHE